MLLLKCIAVYIYGIRSRFLILKKTPHDFLVWACKQSHLAVYLFAIVIS